MSDEKRRPGNPRPKAMATCHPDRTMHAKGKCELCYRRDWARERGRQSSPEVKLRYHLRRWYGLSVEEWRALRDTQDGLCAICGEAKPLVVDHDHETGRVRGLLCRKCNAGIGYLADSAERVQRALTYLGAAA